MSRNPLKDLHRFGVSVWYDNISRGLIASGGLARLISDGGVRGVTSNPTIFEKAIGGSTEYDEAIRRLCGKGSPQEIFEALAVEDIQAAADAFKPLYAESGHRDGFVSLELPPALARQAQASHREALRLHALVDRPNVMIKIPGTIEGLEAFENSTADGVPINVTLLFSQDRYRQVIEAYLAGLSRRLAAKKDLSRVASVASFFVSRVDTAIDPQLKDPSLAGKAAVANAKLAYQIYKQAFASPRFAALKKAGAQPQRLLWASTGTKNPSYRDTLYVEELIGPNTVNTVPPATLEAFRDHGQCRPSLEDDVGEARRVWAALPTAGIDVPAVMARLEEEGLKAFSKSFETLMGQIAAKKELLQAESSVVQAGLKELESALFASRLWAKDSSLWKSDQEHQKIIRNSLGWLTVADAMAAGLGTIRAFVEEARGEGFQSAVVLGMGGSSLCCEVFRACFPPANGFPRLEVLDSTHPAAVAALEERLDLGRTLFIVSSKSGSTIEPNCFMDYFFERCAKRRADPGRQFIAITDPGTSLEKSARARRFRRVFVNPPDIGGRYCALSFFGLVPAALMGIDVARLLDRARSAARELGPSSDSASNVALRLGAAMGRHAAQGQDKLTLLLPRALEAFGLWVEQLVAESTGKEGRGIVPVCGEPAGDPARYGNDRLFVRLDLAGADDDAGRRAAAGVERAGHPVTSLQLRDAYDLGAQFLIWEIATAAAGFLLRVDPFDQPDVQSAKDQAKALLASLTKGALPTETTRLRAGGLAAFCDGELSRKLAAGPGANLSLAQTLAAHLARLRDGDYVAVLAYLPPDADNHRDLEALRSSLRRLTTAPVSVQFGPRYLHSTGQLYKGGGDRGLFLQIVDPGGPELPVPGQNFSFGTLLQAQARGDFGAMLASGRRALRLTLAPAGSEPLKALVHAVDEVGALPRA